MHNHSACININGSNSSYESYVETKADKKTMDWKGPTIIVPSLGAHAHLQ